MNTAELETLIRTILSEKLAPTPPAPQQEPVSYTHLDVYKRQAKLTGDYLHTSAIIVGEGQVLSAVNDVNDYAGPATGYRLQGERWEEIKNIPGALDPNELG